MHILKEKVKVIRNIRNCCFYIVEVFFNRKMKVQIFGYTKQCVINCQDTTFSTDIYIYIHNVMVQMHDKPKALTNLDKNY